MHACTLRTDRGKVVTHAAAAPHGFGCLQQSNVDTGQTVFVHALDGVAHRLHEAVDERCLDTRSGRAHDAACPQGTTLEILEEFGLDLPAPRLGFSHCHASRNPAINVVNARLISLRILFQHDVDGKLLRRNGDLQVVFSHFLSSFPAFCCVASEWRERFPPGAPPPNFYTFRTSPAGERHGVASSHRRMGGTPRSSYSCSEFPNQCKFNRQASNMTAVRKSQATHDGSTADPRAWRVLWSSTFAFTICFAIWMMFAILGIPLKTQLGLSDTEFGLIAATPVLSGSLARVPLGICTDRFGGRIVFFLTMLATVIPIWMLTYATQFWQFIALGLLVGLAGACFSIGTPYVARWFPKDRQGLAMGIFGAGNAGSALTKFVAPILIVTAGT